MELLIAALVASQIFAGPAAGTFITTADKDSIIRTDTRTGHMERCSVSGNVVTCSALVATK